MWGFRILDLLESLAECYLPVSLLPYIFFIGAGVHGVLFRYGEHPEPEMTGGAEHGNVIWNDCGRGGAGNLHYRGGRRVAEPLAIAAARNR